MTGGAPADDIRNPADADSSVGLSINQEKQTTGAFEWKHSWIL
jgi:hypothetical protein